MLDFRNARSAELHLKSQLIDYLLPNLSADDLIVSELLFAHSRRRADISVIGSSFCAFEIKTVNDNLTRLDEQISDYCQNFHEVTLVTEPEHINFARGIVSDYVGLILYEKKALRLIRKAKRRALLNKSYLSSLCSREEILISGKLKNASSSLMIDELRNLATQKLTYSELQQIAKNTIHGKYALRYKEFLKSRGDVTHPDDLIILRADSDNEISA